MCRIKGQTVTEFLDKKLDRIIELHQEEVALLKTLTAERCTCKKHRDKKKEKKEKKRKKEG